MISLVFYFYYGTFFSQGVFLQIIFLAAVVWFCRRDARRYFEGMNTQLLPSLARRGLQPA